MQEELEEVFDEGSHPHGAASQHSDVFLPLLVQLVGVVLQEEPAEGLDAPEGLLGRG